MFLALVGACSPTAETVSDDLTSAECEAAEPAATIGTGECTWEDLAPGDEVTMVHGPQGGWHILGSVRLTDFYPNVVIRYTITDGPSGQLVSDNEYFVQQVPLQGCEGQVVGRYGYLSLYEDLVSDDDDTPWELLACHPVTLDMAITDPTWDKSVDASIDVIAVPDPADSTAACP